MIDKYISFYSDISSICTQFISTKKIPQLHEENNSIEIFSIMCLDMFKNLSSSILVLLKNQHYSESIVLIRNIFEIFFSLNWVLTANNHNEGKERVFQLEADPYNYFEREVNLMERDLQNNSPVWSKESVSMFRDIITDIKNNYPCLITKNSKDEIVFKSAPDLASRMKKYLRLKYYHIYRFASIFSHPTPFLKELYFKRVSSDGTENIIDIISEPLFQMLANGLLFIELGLGYILEVLHEIDPDNHQKRELLYQKTVKIVDTANIEYFPKPK